MNKMRRWDMIRGIAGVLAVLIYLVLCWSAAYFITSYVYARTGTQPSDFARQLINSVLGFFIVGCSFLIFSLITRIQQKQMALMRSMNDAMRRIAKGDFNVSLKVRKREGDPFGELAGNINYMAEELGQMERMRQSFISDVSHELQSPLTSINGFSRALQDDGLSREERLHYLGIIEAESLRLSKLSENLLRLASLESDHHPFEPKPYRLDKQLRNIILSCEPQWAEKGLDFDISLEQLTITADEDMLNQVWMNLLSNSIKFTPNGGAISVRLQRENREAVVRISDTGIGIAEEDQRRVFERFYKADKSRNPSTTGSGLGLAIVKKITDMHKGTVQVESQPGEGTKVTVRLSIVNPSD